MTDQTDQPAQKPRRRRATTSPGHPDVAPASLGQGVQAEATASTPAKRRAPRKRAANKSGPLADRSTRASIDADAPTPMSAPSPADAPIEISQRSVAESAPAMLSATAVNGTASQPSTAQAREDIAAPAQFEVIVGDAPTNDIGQDAERSAFDDENAPSRSYDAPPPSDPPHDPPSETHHRHGWVYIAMGVFVLALAFGIWGVWTRWFAHSDEDAKDAVSLQARNERLSQEVSTLRRSDQISREANRDLQRTLAERDEEIAGLRADVAFYERFVGATGQRRGLSVHDLEMQLQSGDAWHFVATLTQNLNRGAVNTGRLTLSIEGTRNDRLERLSWTKLRKENNAPGSPYSFKYFQQVEGDVLLPKDFKPVRVIVRLVPAGGSAVEQSFTWAETLDSTPTP
jgi:hypothetical protein